MVQNLGRKRNYKAIPQWTDKKIYWILEYSKISNNYRQETGKRHYFKLKTLYVQWFCDQRWLYI